MVRWCIRLTRLTLVCEVIRYRLVQVRQKKKKKKKKESAFSLAERKVFPFETKEGMVSHLFMPHVDLAFFHQLCGSCFNFSLESCWYCRSKYAFSAKRSSATYQLRTLRYATPKWMGTVAGSNLPGIASQFANQILGTANQLRNAEQKSANQKKLSAKRCNRCIALDSQQLARSQSRQHDQPETAGAATVQPGAGPKLASSGLLLITRSFLIWARIRFGTARQGDLLGAAAFSRWKTFWKWQ